MARSLRTLLTLIALGLGYVTSLALLPTLHAASDAIVFTALPPECPAGPGVSDISAVGQNGHTVLGSKTFTSPSDAVTFNLDLLGQSYLVSLKTLIGGKTFYANRIVTGTGPLVPLPPAPTPTPPKPTQTPLPNQSPSCVETTTAVVGNDVWSIGTGNLALKNGVRHDNGQATIYLPVAGVLYALGTDGKWYPATLTSWGPSLSSRPSCQAPIPTPQPSDIAVKLDAIQQALNILTGACVVSVPTTPTTTATGKGRVTIEYDKTCLVPVKGAALRVIK